MVVSIPWLTKTRLQSSACRRDRAGIFTNWRSMEPEERTGLECGHDCPRCRLSAGLARRGEAASCDGVHRRYDRHDGARNSSPQLCLEPSSERFELAHWVIRAMLRTRVLGITHIFNCPI